MLRNVLEAGEGQPGVQAKETLTFRKWGMCHRASIFTGGLCFLSRLLRVSQSSPRTTCRRRTLVVSLAGRPRGTGMQAGAGIVLPRVQGLWVTLKPFGPAGFPAYWNNLETESGWSGYLVRGWSAGLLSLCCPAWKGFLCLMGRIP